MSEFQFPMTASYCRLTRVQSCVSFYWVFFNVWYNYRVFFHVNFLASNKVAAFLSTTVSIQFDFTLQTSVFTLAIIEICWNWTWSSKHIGGAHLNTRVRPYERGVCKKSDQNLEYLCHIHFYKQKKSCKKGTFTFLFDCTVNTSFNTTLTHFSHFAFKRVSWKFTDCILCSLISSKTSFDRVCAYSEFHSNHFSFLYLSFAPN